MKRVYYVLLLIIVMLCSACQSQTNIQSIDGDTVHQMLQNKASERNILVDILLLFIVEVVEEVKRLMRKLFL